jgi:DNA repair exonuclease SbcCD ATPase subunit
MTAGHDLYGVTRIVLINSGKFIYGDFNRWDVPCLVLTGQNNFGKTTLINALQFLYIDDQGDMKFGPHKGEATRRYYFPNQRQSYIIFECRTERGFRTVIVACPTPSRDLQRWMYEGAFKRDYFIKEEKLGELMQVRDFQDVKALLVDRNLREIKVSEYARCLIGKTSGTQIPSLEIIPIRDEDTYKRFREIFTNLLRLKDLDERSLRKLLLDVYRGEFIGPELNVSQEYGEWFRDVRKKSRRIESYRHLMPSIKRLIENYTTLRQLHGQIPWLWMAFIERHKVASESAQKNLDACKKRKEHIQERREALRSEQSSLNERLPKIIEERSGIDGLIKQLKKNQDELKDFNEREATEQRDRFESELNDLKFRFRRIESFTLEQLEQRKNALAKRLRDLSSALARMDSTVAYHVVRLTDESSAQKAFSVFPRDLLAKTVGKGQVELKDPDRAKSVILSIAGVVTDKGGLKADWVTLPEGSLDSPNMGDYLNAENLESQIQDMKAQQEEVNSLIDLALKREHYSQRMDVLTQSINQIRDKITLANKVVELEAEVSKKSARYKELLSEEKKIKVRHVQLSTESSTLDTDFEEAFKSFNKSDEIATALIDRKNKLDLLISKIRSEMLEWVPEKSDLDANIGEHILANQLEELINKRSQAIQRIQNERSQLMGDPDGSEILTAAKTGHELEHLTETIHTIEDQKEDARRTWEQGVNSLTSRLQSILAGLDTMKQRVTNINTALGRIKVSDLKEIRIELSEDKGKVRRLKTLVDHEQTPLFVESGENEKAIEWLDHFINQNEAISVLDLFHLEFHVEQANGQKVIYTKLNDETESTGTAITIKVLINILLLQGLLGKALLKKVRLFFYLDEAGRLDPPNLAQIAKLAHENGLLPVYAAPAPVELPWALHVFIQAIPADGRPGAGRVIVGDASYHEVQRKVLSVDDIPPENINR